MKQLQLMCKIHLMKVKYANYTGNLCFNHLEKLFMLTQNLMFLKKQLWRLQAEKLEKYHTLHTFPKTPFFL